MGFNMCSYVCMYICNYLRQTKLNIAANKQCMLLELKTAAALAATTTINFITENQITKTMFLVYKSKCMCVCSFLFAYLYVVCLYLTILTRKLFFGDCFCWLFDGIYQAKPVGLLFMAVIEWMDNWTIERLNESNVWINACLFFLFFISFFCFFLSSRRNCAFDRLARFIWIRMGLRLLVKSNSLA